MVAIVTGATRGIGRYTADLLAANGHAVAVCSRSATDAERTAAELAAEHDGATYGAALDVRDPAAAASYVSAVEAALGPIAVLVNNAAVLGPVGPIDEVDLTAWEAALLVDLFGVAVMTASVVPSMRRTGGGRVINLAGGGVGGPGVAARLSAYTAAKAGVLTLTETLAAELAPASIQVNAIAPGAIATDFMASLLAGGPDQAGDELYAQTVRQRENPDSLVPFGELLLHLAQPGAGGLTGRTVSARWDSIDQLEAAAPQLAASSRYRMRRIDEALYAEREARS